MSRSASPRLWVIDPSVSVPETEGVKEIVGDWPGEYRLFQPALIPGDGPAPGDGHETDGVIVMGSGSSVYDDSPWIASLSEWLRPLVAGDLSLPLLGICFGHQLVAHLAGAAVGFLSPGHEKQVGIETSTLDGGSLRPGLHEMPVVVSHREVVSECPNGYRVVAKRPSTAIDGLEHSRGSVFTFQFHPEARGEFAVRAGIDPSRIDEQLRRENRRLLAAFRDRVATSSVDQTSD